MGTLKTHLAQVDIRKKNSAVYRKHMQLDPKKRGAENIMNQDAPERTQKRTRDLGL